MRNINLIVIHCSATPHRRDVTASDIDAWHRKRGFNKIGYHFVVRLDGTVEQGRPLDEVGAHCAGHNRNSVGVCYVGGLDGISNRPADTRTPQQKVSLRLLLAKLKRKFPDAVIRSHRDFAPKACPCFDATAEYACIS